MAVKHIYVHHDAGIKPTERRDFFVRCRRGGEVEDHGRDYRSDGVHMTLAEANSWLRANTVNGVIEGSDGRGPFKCEVIQWA